MRVALDAMGGDYAPEPIVEGGVEAAESLPGLEVVLVGDAGRIEPLVRRFSSRGASLSIHPCSEVIGMDESPAEAVRRKRDSSVVHCWQLLASGQVDAVVSAGNTGAVVAAGLLTRRFLPGIKRPGIAVVIPSAGGPCVLIDVGANTAAKPEHLFQYGLMGSIYARQILQVSRPRIGLMNVGTEEAKGNELTKETHLRFENSHLASAFVGNIEGRDIFAGRADVIVCDGFVANVVLKVCEGLVEMTLHAVADECLRNQGPQNCGPVLDVLNTLRHRYHYRSYGGAPLLGIDGICIICHGSSDAAAIRNALKTACELSRLRVNELIRVELAQEAV
jgi:glycerol-3-phosphate acyltransferase PlsX